MPAGSRLRDHTSVIARCEHARDTAGNQENAMAPNRQQMIERLVEAALASAIADPDHEWLRGMLENGFAGYRRMPTPALGEEMRFRGLLEFDEPEPVDEDDDEDEDDEDERLVMMSGMVALPDARVDE